MTKRTIIVGDVHGCFDELLKILDAASYDESNDELIFTGDLINKGPNSLGVLKWLHERPNVKKVLGNHELRFLEAAKDPKSAPKKMQFLLNELKKDIDVWCEYISSWPMYVETSDYLVVHGGVVPDKHPSETLPFITANIRYWDGTGEDMHNKSDPAWYELYKEKKLVIYGHWAIQGVMIRENTIGLDSGCVYGRKLSALILPERKIVSVDANKSYA
jgi:hypothetical protein